MKMILLLFITLISSFALGSLIKVFAIKVGVIDKPKEDRKIHQKETPLLGGMAIFLSFFIVLYLVRDQLLAGNLEFRHWFGFFIGACFLMLGGFLDDKYNLKARYQIIWPLLAAISIIMGGVNIEKITNPFGGYLYLQFFSPIIIFIWLMGMMYTTKLLDGIDGLVTGVTTVGGAIIFLFTMTATYFQPDIGIAALILVGSCLGFLILNWYPAKIFLGEGGSLLLGYILGVLAIISGGKIAITLLIMGIPILDVAWTIIRRWREGKNPFKFADRKHLHFRLFDLGLNQRQIVALYCAFALIFGLSAVFLQSIGKILAIVILVLLMFLFIILLNRLDKKKNTEV